MADEVTTSGDGSSHVDRGDADAPPDHDDTADAAKSRRRHLAIVAAVLLGFATVASAWAAYQAARWSGLMAINFNEGIVLNGDAGKAYAEGDATYNLDQSMFIEWITAIQSENVELAEYYQQTLFTDELTVAVQAWADQAEGPDSPFVMEEYRVPGWEQGDVLYDEAVAKFDQAKDDNQRSDNYVLVTVIFASVLFFAGLSGTIEVLAARLILLGIGGALFIAAAIAMAGMPVH